MNVYYTLHTRYFMLSTAKVHLHMCSYALCYCSVGRNLALTWSTWRLVSAWTARWLWTASRAVKCWWSAHVNCQHTLRDGRCLSRDPSSLASPHLSELSWSQKWIERQRRVSVYLQEGLHLCPAVLLCPLPLSLRHTPGMLGLQVLIQWHDLITAAILILHSTLWVYLIKKQVLSSAEGNS